mmetsp:Transcript_119493/g.345515  ORF Transcript_119493/g.345515 Transcript_119493/m.345515 type:complete len:217 (+) Transcript_119493:736-1386(+)
MWRDRQVAILEGVQAPCLRVLQAHQQNVELDVALAAVGHQERVAYVLLNHVGSAGLGYLHAMCGFGDDVHGGAPVPVCLLEEPRKLRPAVVAGLPAVAPPAVLDDEGLGHEVRDQLEHLRLVLEPHPALDVHGDAAEVRLVREVDEAFPQGAVVLAALLVLEPSLRRIDPPLRSLQQVLAEALAMATHLAVRAVKVLPLRVRNRTRRRNWIVGRHN